MIQGGDPEGTGMGGSEETIVGEFASNGYKNDLKHTDGVMSMARTMFPNSASSQFFIMVADAPPPRFRASTPLSGKITEGLEAAHKAIAQVERDYNDMPLEPVVIKSIRVKDAE